MANPYSATVSVIGTTDVRAVIEELETFIDARWKPREVPVIVAGSKGWAERLFEGCEASLVPTENREVRERLWGFKATPPWAFEDKMVVRFSLNGKGTVGLDTLLEFSAQHPSWFFDLSWGAEELQSGHGEILIQDKRVINSYAGGFRSEVSMQSFVEPDPEFFVDHVGLTLPQLFKYRLQSIARQIKYASEILNTLGPDFLGVPRDKWTTADAQKKLDALAAQAAIVGETLYLEEVLFPHPNECPELQAEIDALHAAKKTDVSKAAPDAKDDATVVGDFPF